MSNLERILLWAIVVVIVYAALNWSIVKAWLVKQFVGQALTDLQQGINTNINLTSQNDTGQ